MKPIRFTAHAMQRCKGRGASLDEVRKAIREGRWVDAYGGKRWYKLDFEFSAVWQGRRYAIKQVAPVIADEETEIVVITVYTYYYGEAAE
jgi:hypothetical protein